MAVTPAPPPDCVTPEAGGRGADLRRRLVWGQGFGVGNRVAQAAAAPASLSGVPRHESGVAQRPPFRRGEEGDLLEEAGPGGARVAGGVTAVSAGRPWLGVCVATGLASALPAGRRVRGREPRTSNSSRRRGIRSFALRLTRSSVWRCVGRNSR